MGETSASAVSFPSGPGADVKKYLAVFIGIASARAEWDSMTESKRAEKERAGVQAWKKWAEVNQSSIVDPGTPLGKTKRVSAQGVGAVRNNIVAYVIVQAESHEAAAAMFEQHPHFMIFPGDSVEVMECLPMPQTRA
jgi:hypothetical protein